MPSSGGTHRLVRLLGPARAKELILLRERVDAPRRCRLGLVTESPGDPLGRSVQLGERLAALPPLAVQVT